MSGERLAGRTAIVVGAGQMRGGDTVGNGRAISIRFAREGARLLCVDRDQDSAEETASLIRAEGGDAIAFRADLSEAEDCRAVVGAGLARWGRLDILVNNVGIAGAMDGPAHRLDDEAWIRILDINLTGMWRTIKAAVPAMRAQRSGSIVNISSLSAISGGAQTAYEVSKAGVNRLTINVASANAHHGIRCNAIMPGLMDTPMAIVTYAAATKKSFDVIREERSARVPLLGGMGSAWDTANAALFLASPEANFITGVILPVDGGMSVRIGW